MNNGELNILFHLLKLAGSGFQVRTAQEAPSVTGAHLLSFPALAEAITKRNNYANSDSLRDLKIARDAYEKVIRSIHLITDPRLVPMAWNDAGTLAMYDGDLDTAEFALEKSIETYKNVGPSLSKGYAFDYLYKTLHDKYVKFSVKDQSVEKLRLEARMKSLSVEATNHFFQPMGEPKNNAAWRVEQGEIGFSASTPIGTWDVHDCLAVALHNPKTKMTALAHISSAVEEKSFYPILSNMQDQAQKDGVVLEARLIGANFPARDVNTEMAHLSTLRLATVANTLFQHHVNIKSCDMFDVRNPTTFCVHPLDFTLTESFPAHDLENTIYKIGIPLVQVHGNPLHTAFDLTQSHEVRPPLLSTSEINHMRSFFYGHSEMNYFPHLLASTDGVLGNRAAQIVPALALCTSYEESLKSLTHVWTDLKLDFSKKNITVKKQIMNDVHKHLHEAPLYIGIGAEKANAPLLEAVRTGLFSVSPSQEPKLNILPLYHFANRLQKMHLSR